MALLEQMTKCRKMGKSVIHFVKVTNFNVFMEKIEIPYPWNVFLSINVVMESTIALMVKVVYMSSSF